MTVSSPRHSPLKYRTMPSSQAQAAPILAPAMSASPPALEDAPRETTAVRTPLVEPRADGESHTGDEGRGEDQGRERKETFHAAHASPEPSSGKVRKFFTIASPQAPGPHG